MRLRALFALVLAPILTLAASGQTAAPAAAAGIAHVAYRVHDADAELAFFSKLGYQLSFSFTNKEGKVTQHFVKVNDRQFIELYTLLDPAQPTGWLHVCYESADLGGYAVALAGRGLKPGEVHKAGAGNLITSFNDPDGRTTEFTQYMPGSKHLLDQRLHISPNRISAAIEGITFASPDQAAAKTFYQQMGFPITPTKNGLHVQITLQKFPWIDLTPAGSPAALYLHVDSLKKAKAAAEKAGLATKWGRKQFSVADPDGNVFIFVE